MMIKVECLNVSAHAALEQSLDFFPLLTVETNTPFSHEDNRNCKRFAFICVQK